MTALIIFLSFVPLMCHSVCACRAESLPGSSDFPVFSWFFKHDQVSLDSWKQLPPTSLFALPPHPHPPPPSPHLPPSVSFRCVLQSASQIRLFIPSLPPGVSSPKHHFHSPQRLWRPSALPHMPWHTPLIHTWKPTAHATDSVIWDFSVLNYLQLTNTHTRGTGWSVDGEKLQIQAKGNLVTSAGVHAVFLLQGSLSF